MSDYIPNANMEYCKTSLLVKWEQNRKTQEMIDRINNIKGLSKKAKEK